MRLSGWNVNVLLPELEINQNVLTLQKVDTTLRNFGFVEVLPNAFLRLSTPVAMIVVDLQSPTATTGGSSYLDANLLDALKSGKLDDLPIVSQVLQTELEYMSITGKPLAIDEFCIRLHHPLIKIELLEAAVNYF